MDFKNVLLIVGVIIVLYLVYLTLFKDTSTHQLFSAHNAKSYASFNAKDLPGGGLSSDYSYSFWIYVSNYNYRFGVQKPIIVRAKDADSSYPYIGLAGSTNNLEVIVSHQGDSPDTGKDTLLVLDDIPLQKWTHIVVTTGGRTVDIYLDGKLVKTSVLPNMPFTTGIEDAKIHVCPLERDIANTATANTGFAGHMTKLEYFDRSLNPREVYERYKAGFGEGGAAGEMMSKFNLKIAFLQDDKEVSGLTI